MLRHSLVINKDCTGFEKRLYKAVRLWLLYGYRFQACGWTRKYKVRHKEARDRMWFMADKILFNHLGKSFSQFEVKVTGSQRVLDLDMDRNLEFMLVEKAIQ